MVTMTGMYMDRAAYNIKKSVRDWFREQLEMLFQAAGLIIDTLRTFFLIVLSILGPLAFAISVYDLSLIHISHLKTSVFSPFICRRFQD